MDSKVTIIAPIVDSTQAISSTTEIAASSTNISQSLSNATLNRPKLTISKKVLMKVASSNTIAGSHRDSEQSSGLRAVKSAVSLRNPHADGDHSSSTLNSGIAGVKRDNRDISGGPSASGSTAGNIPKKPRFKLGSSASTTNLSSNMNP